MRESNIPDRDETIKYLEDLSERLKETPFIALGDNYIEQLKASLNYSPRLVIRDLNLLDKQSNKSENIFLEYSVQTVTFNRDLFNEGSSASENIKNDSGVIELYINSDKTSASFHHDKYLTIETVGEHVRVAKSLIGNPTIINGVNYSGTFTIKPVAEGVDGIFEKKTFILTNDNELAIPTNFFSLYEIEILFDFSLDIGDITVSVIPLLEGQTEIDPEGVVINLPSLWVGLWVSPVSSRQDILNTQYFIKTEYLGSYVNILKIQNKDFYDSLGRKVIGGRFMFTYRGWYESTGKNEDIRYVGYYSDSEYLTNERSYRMDSIPYAWFLDRKIIVDILPLQLK
ncbi:hypothetical protein [Moraxella bovis]|uniref:hypothetical protein n=1 Tax=Moraxella bovis TaxID=476 RepID=UPI002227E448|nr:hypothetical protein [Moraxella bovis]UZA19167.1 hypothetical protein LP088_12865 [Moraxella bovis]